MSRFPPAERHRSDPKHRRAIVGGLRKLLFVLIKMSSLARFAASKYRNFTPILKEYRQGRAHDLLGEFVPVSSVQPVARFQTCTYLLGIDRRKRKSYNSLPQPDLKPIGPEDYERWRTFLKHQRKPQLNRMDYIHETQSEAIPKEIFQRIDQQIRTENTGRLFAVVQLAGKQFKITTEDIIVVQGIFAPAIGDEIQLEKVLLVGSADFTLIGRPLLNKDLLKVEASVIEKTLSHIMTNFKMLRRKQYKRINFKRELYTMLRINNIQLREGINVMKDVDGLEDRIF